MKTMKAVRKVKAQKGFELVDTPVPKPASDQVLLKVLAASLCGTDVHVHDWDPPFCEGRLTPPITTGHEVCAEVIEVGSEVKNLKVGDIVSAESHIPCISQNNLKLTAPDKRKLKAGEECEICKMGNGHICQYVKFFSVDVDGFLAEYAVAPANILWKNPKDMPWRIASLQESLGNSVYTVEVSDVKDKDVAVFGLGPTGLNAVAVAKCLGAKQVIAIAGTEKHAELAQKMGATTVLNRHQAEKEGGIVEKLKSLTNGRGPHVCLEMSGHAAALEQCLDAVMTTGIVSILGLYNKPLTLDVSKKIVLKDVTVRGIYGRKIWQTWELTSKLLLKDGLDISPIITHEYVGLDDFEKGINSMKAGACGKVVFYPHGKSKFQSVKSKL